MVLEPDRDIGSVVNALVGFDMLDMDSLVVVAVVVDTSGTVCFVVDTIVVGSSGSSGSVDALVVVLFGCVL